MNSDIWVLGDNRLGNTNQAIALAEEIGLKYEVKNIKYNIFSKLPNSLLALSSVPIHIQKDILQSLGRQELPKLIISAGRRTAPLALYLKRKFNKGVKIVQIMRPSLPPQVVAKEFDLVVLPQHDYLSQTSPNIVRAIGALSNVKTRFKVAEDSLAEHYPELGRFIAVIIGGSSKQYKFSAADAKILCALLNRAVENHLLPLFISFSRRTPEHVKQIIIDGLKNLPLNSHIIYDPYQDNSNPNPYVGMLAKADYIISTADSISMGSDAASSGKPLYIFCPDSFKLKKHRFFIQQLVDLGVARALDDSINTLQPYEYKPLYEVKKIAELVKSSLDN